MRARYLRHSALSLLALFVICCAGAGCAATLKIPLAVEGLQRLITTTDLITLREIGGAAGTGLSLSPDGQNFAFEMHQADVAANSYRVAWFVGSTSPGSVTTNVGNGGDPTLFRYTHPNGRVNGAWLSPDAKWSPDSRGIAYLKKVEGETQVWWSSRDGKKRRQLTHNAADVEAFFWSRDGSKMYFATGAPRAKLRALSETLYRTGYLYDYHKDWSVIDGRPWYPPYERTGGKPRIWVVDVDFGFERQATADERTEYQRLKEPEVQLEKHPHAHYVAWTEDRRGVAWLQADDPEMQGLSPPLTLYASLSADGSNPVRCPAPECTGIKDHTPLPQSLYWATLEDEIFFFRKEGIGYSKQSLFGWRIGDEQVRRIVTTDEWVSDCTVAQRRVICFRETPTYPRTVIAIDLSDGSIETLVDPNPQFRNIKLGEVELFEWANADGIGTFGYLVKPPDYVPGHRYPMVFVGYRARRALRGGTGNEYPVHVFARMGFIVLAYQKPSAYRAFAIYADRIDIARAMWGPDLFDVRMPSEFFEYAVRTLAEKGLVDPTRVAVTGLSAGVGDVNYALIHSDLFAAAITSGMAFVPNGRALIGASGEPFREYLKVIGAWSYPGPHGFIYPRLSLSLNAERMNTPLLVNVSDQEHPPALKEVVALIEKSKPIEMVVYPDEGHIKWQPAHRMSVYERNVDWLNFWLRGVEDPSPEKRPQYARWHRLRDKQAKGDADGNTAEPAG